MPTYVAMLRSVNVGGRNKVAMAELRELFESLGHTDVRTYIQSGNVIFTSTRSVLATHLEDAIEAHFGIDVPTILRTPTQLEEVVRNNPFNGVAASGLHVGFMSKKPSAANVSSLDQERFVPEKFMVIGTDCYLHLPNGMARTRLPGYLDRHLKVPFTVRNWNTVNKLVELTGR